MASKKSVNSRITDRWQGYYLSDCDCTLCKHYRGKKRGCGSNSCRYEDEKLDAIAHGRWGRKPGSMKWDG